MAIRKVLAATINYDHPQRGMLGALRELFGEHAVVDFDYLERMRVLHGTDQDKARTVNREFLDAVTQAQPDWIWLQLQETNILTDHVLYAARRAAPRAVVTHWMGDMRATVSDYLARICAATHATFASNAGQLPDFLAAGAPRAEYLQIGLDWEEDVLGQPEWEPPFRVPDVVFCGAHYGAQFPEGTAKREAALRALIDAGCDVGIVGYGWPDGWPVIGECSVKQQHHVWKRAKVALSVNHFNIARYYSDRQLIAMAAGSAVVCEYVPGLEHEFQNGLHCYWYMDERELVHRVRELLADEGLRLRMGVAARQEVIKHHTWRARFESILPIIATIQQELSV